MDYRKPPKKYREIENRPACIRKKNGTDEYPDKIHQYIGAYQ